MGQKGLRLDLPWGFRGVKGKLALSQASFTTFGVFRWWWWVFILLIGSWEFAHFYEVLYFFGGCLVLFVLATGRNFCIQRWGGGDNCRGWKKTFHVGGRIFFMPPPPPWADQGTGYTALGSSGYADNTQALAF